MTTGKIIASIRQYFVGKVLSLLFNMLFRLVTAFLPRSKNILISWLQPPSAVILEPPKINSDTTPPYMKDVNCDINNINCWLGEVGVGEKLKHSVFVCDSS